MRPVKAQGSATSEPRTSARADIVQQAEKAIAQYAHLIDVAYDEAQPALFGALAATYAAACDLQNDPQRLAAFLDERRPGPASANPMQPIMRKLWKGVPTRDKLHRYAACIGLAEAKRVKPEYFAEWLRTFPGGIKKAAADWSKTQRLPEARVKVAREKKSRAEELLAGFTPIALPDEIGGRQPGLHLAAIRVSPEGMAELITVFDGLPPAQVDSFVSRVLR
jgi:hypothetical protein